MGTLFIFVWLLGAVATWPVLYTLLYRSQSTWDNTDRAFGVIWGGFACLTMWPVVLFVLILIWMVKKSAVIELLKKLEK